jgi:hypothetical protein
MTNLSDTLHKAIIGVGSFVSAFQSLEALVLGKPKRNAILTTQLLQLGHDAIGDHRHTYSTIHRSIIGPTPTSQPQRDRTFGIQTVHHGTDDFEFVLDGKVDKVRVDQDLVWWPQRRVVSIEQRR